MLLSAFVPGVLAAVLCRPLPALGEDEKGRGLMYCALFRKYITYPECVFCDTRAGLEKDSWTVCTGRRDNHPLRNSLIWWLKPQSFKFKLLLAMKWVVRKLSPKSKIMVWSNRHGLHFGHFSFSKLWRVEA